MAVYVSELFLSVKSRNWIYDQHAYLMADTNTELQVMASTIGLKIEWYQNYRFPHYDLTPRKRAQAIRCGAIEDTAKNMVARHVKKLIALRRGD